jgi:tetratricopeptide (TPR) repeat protein
MSTTWPARAPSTRGRLSASSVGELLVFALEHRLNGSLVFETTEGEKSALFVEAGCVTKARTAAPIEPLGRLLLDSSSIDPATLDAGLAKAGLTGRRLGEALLELHAVTSEQLESALAEQLGRQVSSLGRLPGSSAYGFYADRDFLRDWPVCDADPLALIWRSIRDAVALTPRQKDVLASLSGRKLRLHPASAPERLGFSQPEQIVVNALRTRPRALEELLRAALLDGESLQRLMYALLLTHQLDHGQQGLPLDARSNLARSSRPPRGSQPSSAPLGSRSSLPPAAARGSARPSGSRASLPPQPGARASTPPNVAGRTSRPPSIAGRTSPGSSLPPRTSAPPVSPLASKHESQPPRSLSSARPAAPTGSVGERRSESTGSLHPTDPVLLARARANFDAALAHVQRQQFDAAEKLAREATEEDTGSAEYLALHAWLRAQLGELTRPEQASQIVAALDRAALKQRDSVSIRFYRAQVLNRLGREEEALRDFKFVLRRDPGHLEAARELRLHQMRARGEDKKKPSLLAKLFLR